MFENYPLLSLHSPAPRLATSDFFQVGVVRELEKGR